MKLLKAKIIELKKSIDLRIVSANSDIDLFTKGKSNLNYSTNQDLLQINTIFDQIHQQVEARKEIIKKSFLSYSDERENYLTAKINESSHY